MAEEWFWKHKGQMLGPLETETLADLVQKRRVFDRDEVRFAESQQWITGAELKKLFAGSPGASSADAAAALLAHVRRPDSGNDAQVAELPKIHVPRVTGLFRYLGGLVSSAVGGLFVALAGPLLEVFSRWGKPIIAVAVLAIVAIMFARSLDASGNQNKQAAADLLAAGDRLRELRNKKTSEAEWEEFATETRAWLQPTIAELQARAKRFPLQGAQWFDFERLNARTRHDLIRAANALNKELDEGPLQVGDPVAFTAQLQEAVSKLEGQEWRGWQRDRGPARPGGDLELLTIGFIALDVLLVVVGVAWWMQKKRAGRA